jgi:hypothetical protein
MRRSWQTHAVPLASLRTRRHSSSCWTTAAQPSQPTSQLWLRRPSLLPLLLLPMPTAHRMQTQHLQPAKAAAARALLVGSAAQCPHSSVRPHPVHHNAPQAVHSQLGNRRSRQSLQYVSSCWDQSGSLAGQLQ